MVLSGSSSIAGKGVRVAFDGGRLTSDAGVLLLADIERRLGIAERLARCLEDPRSPGQVHHALAEMIRFRVLLIAAGYPDANDCDALRRDPAFKMAVGRPPETGADLCSQPTMSRLENLPAATALKRMMAAMVGLFCDSFAEVPGRIVLDIDDTILLRRRTASELLDCFGLIRRPHQRPGARRRAGRACRWQARHAPVPWPAWPWPRRRRGLAARSRSSGSLAAR